MRLAFRLFLIVSGVLLGIWLNLVLTFSDPGVQTWAARMFASYLSEKTGTTISIQRFGLGFRLELLIQGLKVDDLHGQNLLAVDRLEASPSGFNFLKVLKLKSVKLDKPVFNLVRYQGENDFNYQFLIDALGGDAQSPDTASASKLFPVQLGSLKIQDGSFSYIIEGYDHAPVREMDYNRLMFSNLNLDASYLHTNGDSLNVVINHLSASEQCGLSLHHMQAYLTIRPHLATARQMKMRAGSSSLDLDIEMKFSGLSAFDEFIDSVSLRLEMRPSTLMMSDLGYFSEDLFDMSNQLLFQGKATGTVADFNATDFMLTYGARTHLSADVRMRGLPDIYDTYIGASVRLLQTNTTDLEKFSLPAGAGALALPEQMASLGDVNIRGMFDGKYNDFMTRLSLKSALGLLNADLVMRTNPLNNQTSYKGSLTTKKFELGKLFGAEGYPGKTNMELRVEGSGLSADDAVVSLAGQISSLELSGTTLSEVLLSAQYEERLLSTEAKMSDPKLSFRLNGNADLSSERALYTIDLKLDTADFVALGLMPADSIFALSTRLNGQFSFTGEQDFIGILSFNDTRLTNENGSLLLHNLQLSALEDPFLTRKFLLQSDILQLEAGGKIMPSRLAESFSDYIHHYFGHELFEFKDQEVATQDFYYNLRIKDFSGISSLFFPQFSISRNASLTGVFMNGTRVLQSTFFADSVSVAGISFQKPHLLINSTMGRLTLGMRMEEVELYRSNGPETPSLGLEDVNMKISAASDSVRFDLNWQNAGTLINRGRLSALLAAKDRSTAEFGISSSDILVNDSVLWFDPEGRFVLGSRQSYIDNFGIHLGSSNLLINGSIPRGESDTLSLSFNHWELSNLNFLLASYGISTGGRVNGDLTLANLENNPAFFSNLTIRGLQLNKETLGDARLMSTWSGTDNNIYINAQIIHRGNLGSGRILHLRGFYFPTRAEDNLSLSLQLENFRLKFLNSFLAGYVSGLEGFASGNLDIGGALEKPVVRGNLGLYRTSFIIDYLNVRYSLQHEFPIEPGRIVINDLMLIDTANNRASVNGSITHNHLRDFFVDLRLRPENLIALNTGPAQNELFYGTAVVSGEVLIRGPFDNIDMSMRVISQRGTSMVIPIDLSTSVGTNDYIAFVKEFNAVSGPGEAIQRRAVATSNFGISLETVITPDAGLRIYMPYNTGTLDARGTGNLSLGVNAAGEFTLNGEYMLQSGQFNFTYENLIKRRFDLIEGGRIAWAGDPYDATIDAKGVYRVKASLSGLGLDTTQSLGNRVNVDCIIHLSNNLFNPDIRFGFRFPNLDSQLEQSIFTVIDTTNDAQMTQQMISLLVLGSFASSSGIDNFSIGNSSLDVLSGQLSSWLSQISKDFDIGLYYRPGDQITSDELEVALSTQLFNERVTIDGNFGMVNSRNATQNASNIVGDVDINVKLTRDGRLRLRAYNHSNLNNWMTSSAFDRFAPYTQGVGLSYRQEFDRFNEIFRRKRKPKTNQQ
ncbi:MAG: translocation/assembly module TamB domain-containing protein [Bacteroidetes bacterium]|nr:translocation/assembly module TamB domain-containing protein [Bacteroidota bacterium]